MAQLRPKPRLHVLPSPIRPATLAEEESYGYVIRQRAREVSGAYLEWADGLFYPVLHRLERLGDLESRWEVAENGRRQQQGRRPGRDDRPSARVVEGRS